MSNLSVNELYFVCQHFELLSACLDNKYDFSENYLKFLKII